MMRSLLLFTLLLLPLCFFARKHRMDLKSWRAGVASLDITPKESMWMGGFAFRNHPSEGVGLPIWAKVVVLEDTTGKRAVFISLETSGIKKEVYDSITSRLLRLYGLSKEQVVINNSHTHSGAATSPRYTADPVEQGKILRYTDWLQKELVLLVGKAIASLVPVRLFAANGVSRFQVNRRTNIQYKLHLQTQFNGPNDYAVPVLKVQRLSGQLLALLFGYACHASVLRDYQFSGDYPGYAQLALQREYPGVTALFFQGAGGDQIAHPRNSVASAQQHGFALAASVQRVVEEGMEELTPVLSLSHSEILLPSAPRLLSEEDLRKILKDSSAYTADTRRRAAEQLKQQNGASVPASYPYPIQVWKLGQQTLITLGGEPVVDYALQLKQMLGPQTFVFGYSNYVMAYITTPLILREGGYEGSSSPFFGARWSFDIQTRIFSEVLRLAGTIETTIR